MAPDIHELEVFADYFQFYVCDEARNTDTGEVWDHGTVDRMLATGPDLIAIGTARNMGVPVLLEIHATPPADDFDAWERVIECSFAAPSGTIVVAGCTEYYPDCPRFSVEPGDYAARISYAGLTDLSENGLEGNDRYRVQLWPGKRPEVTVIKR
ncbi:hypothetical protein RCO27_01750 [Sphingosinicella sp. LHD-64]|uniref:hypothetical protein n=1 Tax=Sphingosinicella sp. LHD-64 TaxID=3072139 RepID=UPI00280D3AB8|nr:hypothetical protein [Sphingosinicella sp. LHD-64]MDQ8754941.1 hypothetical protein [Sphingosinicella sp. LHD-64]